MKDGGGVLQLAAFPDDGGLTVTFDLRRRDAECRHRLLAEDLAEILAGLHQHLQVFLVAVGQRVLDHRKGGGAACRWRDFPADLLKSFLDDHRELANLDAHLKPSSPLISSTLRPPMRS